MSLTRSFSKFYDLEECIRNNAGPINGTRFQGITYNKTLKTTILKSVDDTDYYADNLVNEINPEYTLFGINGDQDLNKKGMKDF